MPKEGRHALSFCPTVAEKIAEYKADDCYDGDEFRGAKPGAQVWTQDGPPIFSEPGETFIEAHLWTRYYGPGYERGNWPIIKLTAEWLETRFPGGEVWYGGDSSGICAEKFDAAAREEIHKLYLTDGHKPYTGFFGTFSGRQKAKQTCDFCGGAAMINSGGGGGTEFWHCAGCGLHRVVDEKGVAHNLSRKRTRDNNMAMFKWKEIVAEDQLEAEVKAKGYFWNDYERAGNREGRRVDVLTRNGATLANVEGGALDWTKTASNPIIGWRFTKTDA